MAARSRAIAPNGRKIAAGARASILPLPVTHGATPRVSYGRPTCSRRLPAPQLKLDQRNWLIGTVTYIRDENGGQQLRLWPPEAFTIEPTRRTYSSPAGREQRQSDQAERAGNDDADQVRALDGDGLDMSVANRLYRRVMMAIAPVKITATDDTGPVRRAQIRGFPNETIDAMPALQIYGLASRAPTGSDAMAIFCSGDRSNGVIVATGSQQFRLRNLKAGEIALHDNAGSIVKLAAGGKIEIAAPARSP